MARDHPRGCGENTAAPASRGLCIGSPPRMRGKLLEARLRRHQAGITPADAGKTKRQRIRTCRRQDHPRGCGENLSGFRTDSLPIGSPPRMRGKPVAPSTICHYRRITPADAGKTILRHFRRFGSRDHPRGCGENLVSPEQILHNIGSPPRMRGKHSVRVLLQQRVGITPADAGKTPLARASAICQEDHPRGCGENYVLYQ